MRITDLRKEGDFGRRATARVVWEDCDRAPLELYCETDPEFAADLTADPNAFLLAGSLPAAFQGEKRIRIEGAVCPRLRDGIAGALRQLSVWYGPRRVPEIEPTGGFHPPYPRTPACAAQFLTGGVDSFHLLNRNRLEFPADHPERFRLGLVVFGLYAPGQERSEPARDHASRTLAFLLPPATEAGLTLLPAYTNVLQLQPDLEYLAGEFLAAALAFAAHAFSSRMSSVTLASGTDLERLSPAASHPMLDPSYGSAALSVRHEGILFSRTEKLREVLDWQTAFRRLVVCGNHPASPLLNCGRCEKCLRTMTGILALGGSLADSSFPASDVRAEDLRAITLHLGTDYHWRHFVPLLSSRGRDDLVRVISSKLRLMPLRRVDRRWFGGRFVKGYRGLRALAFAKRH